VCVKIYLSSIFKSVPKQIGVFLYPTTPTTVCWGLGAVGWIVGRVLPGAGYYCGVMMNDRSMKSIGIILSVWVLALAGTAPQALAQAGGGFGDPAERINQQKQVVLDSVRDLSDDQKLIIDQIYADFTEQVVALRNGGDFMAMREQLPAIAEQRDTAMKDLLTEDQYAQYEAILAVGRERMRQRMNDRGGRGGRGRNGGGQ